MKNILVTGGLGFIGTNLIITLLKKKYKVINIDKFSAQSNNKFLNFINKKYFFYKINLAKKKSIPKIESVFRKHKPNYIINLASETHVDRSIDNPKVFIQNNLKLVKNILICLKRYKYNKIKLIHLGTDEVYGDLKINSKSYFTEKTKFNPNNPYSFSKARQINFIETQSKIINLNYVILNPSNNYGPYQHFEKFIPRSIAYIKSRKSVEIYGKGRNIRNWIYVQDTVNAIIKLMLKGKSRETYIVASKDKISNNALIDKIFKILKIKKKIKFVQDRPGHDRKYFSSNKKLIKLGWKTKVNLKNGLKKTISWYMKNENLKYFKFSLKKLKRLGLKKI